MTKITIAIDGYSSTGKSTVAKQLAKHLGYVYIDSGAMYRAVTYYAMSQGLIDKEHFNSEKLISKLKDVVINFVFNKALGFAEVYLNGINIEKEIRTLEVSNYVSKVSAISEVRIQLVKQQQNMGKDKGIVMDGRDIGTVVFPHAELKFFMTATAETRALRRYDELKKKDNNVSFKEVLKNVQERDYLDSTREDSPLYKADDAIEIDNSNLSVEAQFTCLLKLVNDKLKQQ
ncbi:MAG: (d)CMP kinase [Flavobacteriales bacterium]|nr:(d)CMP kinase [Flavobacteriia bacterium]NCP53151.1 (d)CMP kinase [Flavobacteriales bacterium]PIV94023.1 MAG: cytidylate kinase [Flavobacteriaceae bacterium CG17_big_fil_post_rev_8_21_14_2_50_33_15]PIY12806.1 MAG: cytidylate kinase [Flavobacteriaceae bacterium CG_4_10_14_3_um_filter_33_47]PJB19873.1 MAG: cytidylate kinase [Flavobacteriaceae bacterium CG_4_9_14_3_um_filter_33_16]